MKKIVSTLELAFWNFVTPLLSESDAVRWIFRTGADLVIERKNRLMLSLAIFPFAGVGLVAGFALGRAGLIILH